MEDETQKEIEWRESVKIPNGNHKGTITRIVFKEEPYDYTEVFVKIEDIEDIDIELKYGCPTILSENSKLGKLMIAFGQQFETGKKLNPVEILKGRKVEFITLLKKAKDNKEYSEIVPDSMKPLN